MKKYIKISILVVITLSLLFANLPEVFASFADFTDEQADKQAQEQLKEQEKEHNVTQVKSSNNYLKNLSVNGYQIIPEFDKQTINYEIKEEIGEEYIKIDAETDDEKSSVSGIGEVQLNSGENNIRIDVTAENGSVRTYFIKTTKTIKKDIKLTNLVLEAYSKENELFNVEFTPKFDNNIFKYDCNVPNYIEKIECKAEVNDSEAKVEISGNENLQEGLNEILISISLENEKTIYKINVNKEKKEQIQQENKSEYKYIIIALSVIVILIIIFIVIINKAKRVEHKRKH